jgi:hypothetical protein
MAQGPPERPGAAEAAALVPAYVDGDDDSL